MHLSVIVGVLVLAAAYVWVAAALRRRILPRQALAFAAALATIVIALNGPIDALADDRLFTAHMLQHLLLTMVMPPLLLFGIPEWMFAWALRWHAARLLGQLLTNPLIAFSVYNGFLAVVHAPVVFESMVRNETMHVAIHVGMMVTGTIMWWPLMSPVEGLPRLSYPAQLLYLFVLMVPMAAISAPITLAQGVIYPWYAEGPHPFGLPALSDQILGGLLMWVGAGTYLLCVATLIFFRWARWDDRDEPLVWQPRRPARSGAVRVS